jgi:hypothetical protein
MPCPPFVDSHIPLMALSLEELGGQENGHVFPRQECGGVLGEGSGMCGSNGDQLLVGQTHGGRAPTSDCLWEQQELGEMICSLLRVCTRTCSRESVSVFVCTNALFVTCSRPVIFARQRPDATSTKFLPAR